MRRTIFFLLAFLLIAACDEREIPPAPNIPTSETVELALVGIATGAEQFASIGLGEEAIVFADGETLRQDVADGVLGGAFVYSVTDDFWFNPVVVDGLVIIVHPESALVDVNSAEIPPLFSNPNSPYTLHVPANTTDVRQIFNERVMGSQRVSINAEISPNPDALIAALAADPNAIGVTTIGALGSNETVRVLTINGIAPSPNLLAQQVYPLSIPIYWISLAEPQGAARGVLAMVQSEAGQMRLGDVFGRIR